MLAALLDRLDAAHPSPGGVVLSWADVEAMARQLPHKTNLVVPKSFLGARPPHRPSRLGRPRGALAQFRCTSRRHNLHVKEFDRHWVVHVDAWHPRAHPFRHLLVDHGFRTFLHLAHLLHAGARVTAEATVATVEASAKAVEATVGAAAKAVEAAAEPAPSSAAS